MVINKILKITKEIIFESLVILKRKTNEGIKKINKTKEETP
tara:strand:+ start:682 stop:804 length:123 start_codon:yes stop_codon:yes gene_type:complete